MLLLDFFLFRLFLRLRFSLYFHGLLLLGLRRWAVFQPILLVILFHIRQVAFSVLVMVFHLTSNNDRTISLVV